MLVHLYTYIPLEPPPGHAAQGMFPQYIALPGLDGGARIISPGSALADANYCVRSSPRPS